METNYGRILIRDLVKLIDRIPALGRERVLTQLSSLVQTLTDQKSAESLQPHQEVFLSLLVKLGDSLLDENATYQNIEDAVASIKAVVSTHSKPRSQLSLFFSPTPPLLGSLGYMRSQIRTLLTATTFLVEDRLDCMLYNPKNSDKVVLFCNPNAGYFETVAFQPDWLDIYSSMGYAFCSWNYRGFGRSLGSASVSSLPGDAAAALRHLKEQCGFKRIGVHGRSIGGVCAASLGMSGGLEFVVADRSFTSLGHAAKELLGWPAFSALWFAGESGPDLSVQWLQISSPAKLILWDPEDEIVADAASLKCGVANQLISSDPTFFNLKLEIANEAAAELTRIVSLSIGETSPREGVPLVDSAGGHLISVAIQIKTIFDDITPASLRRLSDNWQVWGLSETEKSALSALTASLVNEAEVTRNDFLIPLLQRLKPSGTSKDCRGQLLKVTCGHNGQLNREEANLFVDSLKHLVE